MSDDSDQEHVPGRQAQGERTKRNGQQYRVLRRAQLQKQKEAARKREGWTAQRSGRGPAVPERPERAHLQLLGLLTEQACDIANDPGLDEEDRRKQLNDTAHAMGKISANAECEREADEHEAEFNRRMDEHKEKKRLLSMAVKKQTCVECQRKMKEEPCPSTPC